MRDLGRRGRETARPVTALILASAPSPIDEPFSPGGMPTTCAATTAPARRAIIWHE
jgi:hypothetical protein